MPGDLGQRPDPAQHIAFSLESIYRRAQEIMREQGTIYRAHMVDACEPGSCHECMAALAVWFVTGIEACKLKGATPLDRDRIARWLFDKYAGTRG
jgi:hypothetical protein